MTDPIIHPIDLNFRGRSGTIGAYLVPHAYGCFLVETGPGSTLNALTSGISALGYRVQDVTDVFLTHIHLDHAGAAGWWASQGAKIHVHQNGAPHLVDPSRLLSSARRLYGELMDELWGEFLPVPQDRLSVLQDRQILQIGELSVLALDVPGHAIHHLAFLVGDACFSGDIAGIRLNPQKFLSLPLPPPDLHIEQWRSSIHHIQEYRPGRIIPTHFGVYPDASWHLQAILNELDEIQSWMEAVMPLNLPLEELRQQFISFEQMRVSKSGIDPKVAESQQIANPSFMSADGIMRYWYKYRSNKKV